MCHHVFPSFLVVHVSPYFLGTQASMRDFESSYEVPMEREEGKRITEHAVVPYRDGG